MNERTHRAPSAMAGAMVGAMVEAMVEDCRPSFAGS
jgi:hypothetical protein